MWKVETGSLGSRKMLRDGEWLEAEIVLNRLASTGWEIVATHLEIETDPDAISGYGHPHLHILARKPIPKETREPGEDD
jgi:hypothetical protein